MSDAKGTNDKPDMPDADLPGGEAELLGPERTEKPEPQRKEPPVIDGEAEDVTPAGEAGKSSSSASSPSSFASSAPSAPETGRGGGRAALWLAVAVIAIGAAGAGAYYLGIGRESGPSPEAEAIAGLDGRLSLVERKAETEASFVRGETKRLDERLGTAEQKIAAEAQSPDSISSINQRLDRLTADADALKQSFGETQGELQTSRQKIDELQRSMPPAGIADQVARLDAMLKALSGALDTLQPRVAEMEARVAALEAKKEDPDAAARAALGLALANLARAAETASPFRSELDAVASFLPNEPGLAALAGPSATGVATKASLKERFPALVQSVLDAERRAGASGLWARFVANARSLVTVRRTGEIAGEDTEAVIARMEERLRADDLAAAVDEGAKLKGAAAEAAAPWLAEARARVETEGLLRELSAHVAARLSKAKG